MHCTVAVCAVRSVMRYGRRTRSSRIAIANAVANQPVRLTPLTSTWNRRSLPGSPARTVFGTSIYPLQPVSVDGFARFAAVRCHGCLAAAKQLSSLLVLWTNILRKSQGRGSFAARKRLGHAGVMTCRGTRNIQSGGSLQRRRLPAQGENELKLPKLRMAPSGPRSRSLETYTRSGNEFSSRLQLAGGSFWRLLLAEGLGHGHAPCADRRQ